MLQSGRTLCLLRSRSANNQVVVRRFCEGRSKPKKPFYKRKIVWIGGSVMLGSMFAAYEMNPNGTFGPKTLATLQKLPLRWGSHMWGYFTRIKFPTWINQRLLRAYAWVYDCNLDEMKEPLESYMSIQDFFVRRLKEEARPFVKEGIASPVDGRIMSIQEVARDTDELEQIKGIEYSLSGFLGSPITSEAEHLDETGTRLYHCIIYLAPGDYHGIHSPVDWKIKERKYFPGYLFPVAPVVVQKMGNLLGMNERVVLSGKWEHGYFSLTPVGATNVGSITLFLEPEFQTNLREHKPNKGLVFPKSYVNEEKKEGEDVERGSEVAFFHMGSTVVLIFESPPLEFDVKPGDKVKMGESIARFSPNLQSTKLENKEQ